MNRAMDALIEKERRKARAALLSWLLVIVPAGIGLAVWFTLRSLVLHALIVFEVSAWAWQAYDQFSFVFFGFVWLALVFVYQYMLYKQGMKGRMGASFRRLTAAMTAALLAAQLLLYAIGGTDMSVRTAFMMAAEAMIFAALLTARGRAAGKAGTASASEERKDGA